MHHQLPSSFIHRIENQLGSESLPFFDSLKSDPVVSVRQNPMKCFQAEWKGSQRVPWCVNGWYLPKRPVFTLDPLFHAGCYYPQEASSMVLDWLLRHVCELPENPVVLDLCGAPGGKSTLLASYLGGRGVLVSNEVIKSRAVILAENLLKWGIPNCVITRNDPAQFSGLTSFFDLLVVDAPCSGEGLFRKDVNAIEEWSESNAQMCASRQRRILSDAWPALKDGGILIYSTCTYFSAENEENIQWLVRESGAEVLPISVPEEWGVSDIPVGSGNGLAFYPHRVKGEGFFVAVVRKNSSEKSLGSSNHLPKRQRQPLVPVGLKDVVIDSHNFIYQQEKDGWHLFPALFQPQLLLLKKNLHLLNYGVLLGHFIRHQMIPSHHLAMSDVLDKQAYFLVELSKEEALRYLRGEALPPLPGDKKGYFLMTFQGVSLGFAKNIGSRMNNLYPSAMRIRMALPDIPF